MNARLESHIYEGSGDDLAGQMDMANGLTLLPDTLPTEKDPDAKERASAEAAELAALPLWNCSQ